jgi:hypothetical protein
MNKDLEKIYKEVAKEFNLPIEVVKVVHKSLFSYIQDSFGKIPIEKIKEDEDLKGYVTVINVSGLGKFYTNVDRVRRVVTINKYINGEYEKK